MHYLGMRHKHERQAVATKQKSTGYIGFLDKLTFIIGILGPLTVLPQIITIFSTQSAKGVSLSTWLLMAIVMLPWVLYGIAHKDKTLITSFVLWVIVNMLVVIGVLLYA